MYATPLLRSYGEKKSKPKPFPVEKLKFLLDHLSWVIDCEKPELDSSELPEMNALCSIPSCKHLKYITNGEFIYEAYKIFIDLTSDEPAKDPILYREAILSEIFNGAKDLFLDDVGEQIKKDPNCPHSLFALYEYCKQETKSHVWVDEHGNPINPPPLDQLTREDWEVLFEELNNFFFWDDDWNLPIVKNFSQYVDGPHWPTFPEFRRAFVWIQDTAEELDELEEGERLLPQK